MDRDDRDLFERSLRNAAETDANAALDSALEEVGWHDALTSDTRDAVSLLFEVQGWTNTTSSALGRVIAYGMGKELGDSTGVVLPAIGRHEPPGRLVGGRLHVHGLALAGLEGCDDVVVVAHDGDANHAVVVSTSELDRRPVHGVDPALALIEVSGDVANAGATRMVNWRSGVALGQVAVGHELVGAAQRMLELARQHALDRIQFDRPIASFQAVRHRLAETFVAIEAADAVLDGAWLDPSPAAATIAKAVCARNARTAARHCQQVLAGIGFTTEHDLHRYVRRVLVLEQLLGATRALTTELGKDVLERRRLPSLLPL